MLSMTLLNILLISRCALGAYQPSAPGALYAAIRPR
jgi:hypothetical protein